MKYAILPGLASTLPRCSSHLDAVCSPSLDRPLNTEESVRLEALIASMSSRLRPLCAEWPETNFNEMVRELAEITLRYEGQATPTASECAAMDLLAAQTKEMLEKRRAAGQWAVKRSAEDISAD